MSSSRLTTTLTISETLFIILKKKGETSLCARFCWRPSPGCLNNAKRWTTRSHDSRVSGFSMDLRGKKEGHGFFAYSWKLPASSGAFLLTVDNLSFFAYNWSLFAYSFGYFTHSFSFFTCSWSFFAYSGKVCLIRAFRDCKQRSLTVSEKAPTVSKKLPLEKNRALSNGGDLNGG